MASREHQELANVIKKVHVDLRKKAKEDGPDAAWNEHIQKSNQLQTYAAAMLKLATEYWDKNNMNSSSLCRIQWVVDKSRDYFKNGGLEAAIEKENKLHKKFFGNELLLKINEEFGDRLMLLDVGSCYNPFKKFNDFFTVPIDLVPATNDVIKCDFLNVNVSTEKVIFDFKKTCHVLPENFFDLVVFSLLLEYLPSSKQRWICCQKAYSVLKTNGLLFILTPDSKHATANSKIIKYWRYALANIGFLLLCYAKLKHLHCLMYRKCINKDVAKHWYSLQNKSGNDITNPEEMICIPQDFHDFENKVEHLEIKEFRCDSDNETIANHFSELADADSNLFD